MAKPKNLKILDDISRSAWYLFATQGYSGTSYDDIAKESKTNRPLVQHYFPRKELLILGGITTLREEAAKQAEEYATPNIDRFGRFYILGQIYVAALVANKEIEVFLLDILDSRSLTNTIIGFDFEWSLGKAIQKLESIENHKDFFDTTIVNMGGFYELLYACVKDGREFDIAKRLRPVILDLMIEFGIDEEASNRVLDLSTLDTSTLGKLGRQVLMASLK